MVRIQIAISVGPVFDDFDNTVKALTNGIGQVPPSVLPCRQ